MLLDEGPERPVDGGPLCDAGLRERAAQPPVLVVVHPAEVGPFHRPGLLLQAASAAGRPALGKRAGRRAQRIRTVAGRVVRLPPRCAAVDGTEPLWSDPRRRRGGRARRGGGRGRRAIQPVGGHAQPEGGKPPRRADVRAREHSEARQVGEAAARRRCRTVCRPALAKSRIEEAPGGGVVLRFKRPWSDGTTGLRLITLELVQRLAALVPPPHANVVRIRCGAARRLRSQRGMARPGRAHGTRA